MMMVTLLTVMIVMMMVTLMTIMMVMKLMMVMMMMNVMVRVPTSKHPTLTQRNQHTTTKRTSQTTFITTQT